MTIGAIQSRPSSEQAYDYPSALSTPERFEERFDIERGDSLEVATRDGKAFDGVFYGLRPPTAADPELYVLLNAKGSRLTRVEEKNLTALPSSEIARLRVVRGNHAFLYGTIAGVVLDVAIVAAVLGARSSKLNGL